MPKDQLIRVPFIYIYINILNVYSILYIFIGLK